MSNSKKINILCIGANQDRTEQIENYSVERGYFIKFAKTFKESIQLIKNQSFSLLIYAGNHEDEKTDDDSVLDIVHQLRQVQLNDNAIKFFIISPPDTSDFDFLENSTYTKLGVLEHTSPNLPSAELFKKLNEISESINSETNKSSNDEDHRYSSIDMENALKGDLKKYDRFLRLNRFKYIMVAAADSDLNDKYKKKGVESIFVRKENYDEYYGENITLLKKAVKQADTVSPERKAELIQKSSSIIFDQLKFDGIDEEVFSHAKESFEASIEVASKSNVTFNLIESLSNHHDFTFAHALGVSHMAVMIAKSMEFQVSKNILDISLAGFMHDCGKLHFDDKIIRVPMHQISSENREKLKQHPLLGYKELSLIDEIPEIVCDMVYQHHENMLGQGYPRGLKASRICMGARIIALANDFCNITIENPCYRKMKPKKAFSQLHATKRDVYDKEVFSGLSKVINTVE